MQAKQLIERRGAGEGAAFLALMPGAFAVEAGLCRGFPGQQGVEALDPETLRCPEETKGYAGDWQKPQMRSSKTILDAEDTS